MAILGGHNGSTPGMSIAPNNEDENEISRDQLENEQESATRLGSHQLMPYRDIPIYAEPGSPLLNRAYLTDDELHSSSNTSESDEWFEVNDSAGLGIGGSFEYVRASCRNQVCMDDERAKDPETTPDSAKEHLKTIKRCSELSFQCSGEPELLFFDEAAWLRSPLSCGRLKKPFKMTHQPPSLPFERNFESWLSDTSSCDDDDLLSSAQVIAPAKANVVDVNVNLPSGLSIQVPPRSSSLGGTAIINVSTDENRDGWLYSSYSPPATPSQPWRGVRNPSPKQNLFRRQFEPYRPKRRLDQAMASPPLSPTIETADTLNTPPVWKEPGHTDPEQKAYDCGHYTSDTEQAGLSADSIDDILTALENLTAHFPYTMLQPDTPCILAIRSQLAPSLTDHQLLKPTNGLISPLFPNQGPPKTGTIVRRLKTTNFSNPRRSPSSATSKSCPVPRNTQRTITQNFHLPRSSPQGPLPPPDMQPLHRIFPKSSRFMRSSLYANVLAHIFVTSLSTRHQPPRSPKKRRDTPYWPTTDVPSKAADVLGILGLGIMYPQSSSEDSVWSERVSTLAKVLRKSITCFTSRMDPDSCQDDSEFSGLDAELGLFFVRSLEEVVRSCEMSSYGSF